MGILLGLFLIVVGLLAAREFFDRKVPALKSTIDAIDAYREMIGLVALLCGFLWFLSDLTALGYFSLYLLIAILASLLLLTLGAMLGLPMLHKIVGEPAPGFMVKIDKWTLSLKPYQTQLGFAAIVLGVCCL